MEILIIYNFHALFYVIWLQILANFINQYAEGQRML